MRSLETQLTNYAAYHRDPRNIATHFVGIPMIVLSILVLTSPTLFTIFGLEISIALLLWVGSSYYYLKLDLPLGLLMAALTYFGWSVGAGLAASSYWGWGLGLFFVGWVLQFIGHFYEGKKPAFVDDIAGLIIGPLFVVTEALFMLNQLASLRETIESKVGPVKRAEAPGA